MKSGLQVLLDADALAEEAAVIVTEAAKRAMAKSGGFRLVLAGGSTPRALHERLAAEPDRIDWKHTEIFFGDERCVPPDDAASNYRMAKETLLDHVPVQPEMIHRIKGELPPEEAAEDYDRMLRSFAVSGPPRFDVVLLGLGDDGHTASLFPGSPALEEKTLLAVATESPTPPTGRVTMTIPVLSAGREVVFLVAGAGKAEALSWIVRDLTEKGDRALLLPPARIRPTSGLVQWLVDQDATPFLRHGKADS